MRKTIFISLVLILFSGQASAQTCPEFFRFVDFGLESTDGAIHRGGPTYRAESFAGQPLLIRELTTCRDVRSVAIDGRGNPIPIVTSVDYNPESTNIDLSELRLMLVDDVASLAKQNAIEHHTRIENPKAVITRGSNYLCASLETPTSISCQVKSPFGGNDALVVYCDLLECEISVFTVRENIIAVATWRPAQASLSDHDPAASEIASKVQQIFNFLNPLSS